MTALAPAAMAFVDIPGILDSSVSDDRHTVLAGHRRAIIDRRNLRNADAGNHTGRADGSRADANFHDIGTGFDQITRRFTGCHIAGDDHQIRILRRSADRAPRPLCEWPWAVSTTIKSTPASTKLEPGVPYLWTPRQPPRPKDVLVHLSPHRETVSPFRCL